MNNHIPTSFALLFSSFSSAFSTPSFINFVTLSYG